MEEDSHCAESRPKASQSKDAYVGGLSQSIPPPPGYENENEEAAFMNLEDDGDDNPTKEPISGTSSQRSRKTTSKVWDYHERTLVNGVVTGAKCLHCKKVLSANTSSGTSHLKKHVEKV